MDCQMFFINFCRCKDKFQKLLVFPIHHSICLTKNEITSQFCFKRKLPHLNMYRD